MTDYDLEAQQGRSRAKSSLHELEYVDRSKPPQHWMFCDYKEAPSGYPKLACYMATAENLGVFRQFRYLQLRIMLQLQDELRELETLLYRLDERDRSSPGLLRSREYCDNKSQTRAQLLDRTRKKWMEYAEFMGKSNDVRSLKNASRYQLGYLRNFFHPRPPIDSNENFLVAEGDLKSVRPDGDGVWLDEVLLYLMIKYECKPLKVRKF
ncbi:hypothetical protein ACHAQA_008622 [Verticillium albo-atrum]